MAIQESWARIRGQGFLGSVGVLVGGTGIAGAISALMLPVLTRLYTPHDFSLLAVLTGMIAIVSVAACLRFDIAIPVPERDSEAANVLGLAVLSLTAIVILLAGAMLVVPASLLARFNQPDLESVSLAGAGRSAGCRSEQRACSSGWYDGKTSPSSRAIASHRLAPVPAPRRAWDG